MIDPEKILASQRGAVPRYTSYPTAPHFSDQAGLAIARSRLETLPDKRGGLALSAHSVL